MKVAVYNRFWNTAGGGEKLAGSVAQTLAERYDVTLLSHEPIDRFVLEERLGIDLAAAGDRTITDARGRWFADETAGYDLLVNCSFTSDGFSGARKSIYYVHFPTPSGDTPKKRPSGEAFLDWGEGFHLPETSRRWRYRWTSGRARLFVRAPTGTRVPVRLVFGAFRGKGVPPANVTIEVEGETVRNLKVGGRRQRAITEVIWLEGRGNGVPIELRIGSDTFVPSATRNSTDNRELGVILMSADIGAGKGRKDLGTMDYLKTYDRLVANSQYTAEWVSRWWGRDADVLYPPSTRQPRGRKEPLILSVGRFFDRGRGHSKKQVEMVHAFRKMINEGTIRGWEYHLVGGCAPEDVRYVEQVRREAQGVPVVVHVDATGAELRSLYARASVLWHGTGLGENERRHPDRFEHFGIATVEAMSAGAVPVVVGQGGQREVVRDGVDGFFFSNVRELEDHTKRLATDDALRRRLSEAAVERSKEFTPERFAQRLHELVEETVRTP